MRRGQLSRVAPVGPGRGGGGQLSRVAPVGPGGGEEGAT